MYTDAHGHKRIDPAGVRLLRLRMMARQWLATAHLNRAKVEAEVKKNEPKFSPPALTPEEVRERMNRLSPFLQNWAASVRTDPAPPTPEPISNKYSQHPPPSLDPDHKL